MGADRGAVRRQVPADPAASPTTAERTRYPPASGPFPVGRVEDFADRVPESWREEGGVFLPMYQREALWLGFEAA